MCCIVSCVLLCGGLFACASVTSNFVSITRIVLALTNFLSLWRDHTSVTIEQTSFWGRGTWVGRNVEWMPDFLKQNGSVLWVKTPANTGGSFWLKVSVMKRGTALLDKTLLVLRRGRSNLSLLMCDKDNEASVQDLLKTSNNNATIRIRIYDVLS